jgi:hypothetical protein
MKAKATNLGLFVATLVAFGTGVSTFFAGRVGLSPLVWAHALAGFALAGLFVWKRRIIWRSLRRRGVSLAVAPGVVLLALIASVLLTGVAWSTFGLPDIVGYSGLTVHAFLGTAAAVILFAHARWRWPRVRRADRPGRRELLRFGAVSLGGLAAWRATASVTGLLTLSGTGRRFTGSRAVQGTDFPETQWLFDNPAPLDRTTYRLRLAGHVSRPLVLTAGDLDGGHALRATIDCTGGWYAAREWQGVALGDLLDRAGVLSGARSVMVRASTGYWRRYTLGSARNMLLATRVGGEPLSHGHGAPARLVVPNGRGYEWVKWVVAVEVSTVPAWFRWPLPV